MPSNADYTREYFQIIDELDGDIESRRAAFNYMQDSTAIVHHQVVASSFVPRLFNRKTYEVMKRTAETSHRILCKVIERYRADAEYRKLFDFDERLVELILLPRDYDSVLPFARVDTFLNEDDYRIHFCEFNGDGSAGMKIGPVGMLHPGDLDRAVADAVTIIRVTHDNDLAISGGCAIAAAVSCAMVEGRNAVDIVNAGLYGAREGMRLARGFAKKLAGPSVEKRISLAAEIGLRHCGDYERAMLELGDVVGAGLHVSEAVPCVFGLVMSTNGHPLETIFSAVNIGNDTDTVAAMAGYIVGALNGAPAYDSYYYDTIEAANHFDLRSLAHEMAACAARN